MFIPRAFDVQSQSEILDLLRRASFGHLITLGSDVKPDAIVSTPLPFVVDDELTHIRVHFARANRQWRTIDGSEALMIVSGADTYVSPRWYPSKLEDGKVVPTWNYEVVHLRGTIEVHDDPAWKHEQITDLTRHNESAASDTVSAEEWKVSDAPDDFIDKQLRAIVGIRLDITEVAAQRKLSQNKSDADRHGVINGLARSHELRDIATANAMQSVRD